MASDNFSRELIKKMIDIDIANMRGDVIYMETKELKRIITETRSSVLEEMSEKLDRWCCESPNHAEYGCDFCKTERQRLNALIDQLRPGEKDGM